MTKLEIAKSAIEKFYRRCNVYGPVDNRNGYSRPSLCLLLHDGDGIFVWGEDYDFCHDRVCVQGLSDEEFRQLKEWNYQFYPADEYVDAKMKEIMGRFFYYTFMAKEA